jgi:hypothetical protein
MAEVRNRRTKLGEPERMRLELTVEGLSGILTRTETPDHGSAVRAVQ